MPYDEDLADRIRSLIGPDPDIVEQPMFGGLAFLARGHLALAASGRGGLLVRVDPDLGDELLETTPARPFEMRGRELAGWLRVADEDVRDDAALSAWVMRGTAHARSLPPKR